MNPSTFAAISAVLVEQFQVDAGAVQPQATLDQLGLDSLALMEFVFAVEDRFDVRIPEDRLDPRQAGVTLEQLARLLDEAVAAKARRRCRQRLGRAPARRSPSPAAASSARSATTLAAFDEALFAGRSAVRAQALDLPGIELPPVPVARGRVRCRGRGRAVARAARPRHGDGAGRRRRRRRATPAWSPAASTASGSASSGAAAWPARRPSRRPAAPSTPSAAACGRRASSRRCRTRRSPSSRCASARAAPPSPTPARARRRRWRSARRCARSAPAGSTSPSPAAASRC